MSYTVLITQKAKHDINIAVNYIKYSLMNEKAAESLLIKINTEINMIAEFPNKAQPVHFLKNLEIRYIQIKKYLLFYKVDGSTIYVLRFVHQKRNWIAILKEI